MPGLGRVQQNHSCQLLKRFTLCVFNVLSMKFCNRVIFFFLLSVHVAETLPDGRQPLSVARQSRDRASVSILHRLCSGVETSQKAALKVLKANRYDRESDLNPFGRTDTESKTLPESAD